MSRQALLDTPFVCIDCETTGLDPSADEVIEVAAARFTAREGILQRFSSLVRPRKAIPEASSAIHHITDEMVSEAPIIELVLPSLTALVGELPIVGHGINFDIAILEKEASERGLPAMFARNQQIDTLRMARKYGESPVNSLDRIAYHFNIEVENAHRAMSDVEVNVAIFLQLLKGYSSLKELQEMLAKPILMRAMPLGRYKGQPFSALPIHYLRWAARQQFDVDLLYSLQSELKRRSRGGLFSQEGNPFQSL